MYEKFYNDQPNNKNKTFENRKFSNIMFMNVVPLAELCKLLNATIIFKNYK